MVEHLSRREKECLALVAQGHSNPEIAQRLGIARETVHRHLNRAYSRLELEDCGNPRARAAVLWATRSEDEERT
jgi:DNA-binding CsgD family transcriptional regulator